MYTVYIQFVNNVFVCPRQRIDLMYLFVRAGASLNVFCLSEQGLALMYLFCPSRGLALMYLFVRAGAGT